MESAIKLMALELKKLGIVKITIIIIKSKIDQGE